MTNPFRYFNSSPEIIRLAVMMHVRFPLSLRQVEDLLHERGIDICHETERFWWNRFGPVFEAAIRKRRVHYRSYSTWRWRNSEVPPHFRNSLRSTLRSTTISIRNVIFTAAKPSSSIALPLWLSGGNLRPKGGGITVFRHQFALI